MSMISAFLSSVRGDLLQEQRKAKEADDRLAAEFRPAVERFLVKTYPKFWDAVKDSITGCCTIRMEIPAGCSPEGATALVVEDRLLIFRYAASDGSRIGVTKFIVEASKLPKGHLIWTSLICYSDPESEGFQNDRVLARLIESAIGPSEDF